MERNRLRYDTSECATRRQLEAKCASKSIENFGKPGQSKFAKPLTVMTIIKITVTTRPIEAS